MVKVLVRGAGDIATGVGLAFHRSGFRVLMTEISEPTVIRRKVAFATVIYDKSIVIEDVEGVLVDDRNFQNTLDNGKIGVIVDPDGKIIDKYKPDVVVDAILAKRNLGTKIDDAPVVIGCGPGFSAGLDCNLVVETKRGHYLGKWIEKGEAAPNSGIPGIVEGKGLERVLYSPKAGIVEHVRKIGDLVEEDELVLKVDGVGVCSPFKGYIRGLIQEGLYVPNKMKIGDVDPRLEGNYPFTVSEKAMAVGRGALEGALCLGRKINLFGVDRIG